MTQHVVLLGDSIFDNAAYTRGAPDVVTHLGALLPAPWRASLYAVDGATTTGIARQVQRVPRDASHVVVSVGGNDALASRSLLDTAVRSTGEALALFHDRVQRFESSYRAALALVVALQRHTTVCTIYNGQLPDAREARSARMALMMFNDAIIRAGIDLGLDVIELRSVCTEPADYANPIEPSGPGGRKIATAIAHAVGARSASEARVGRIFAMHGDDGG